MAAVAAVLSLLAVLSPVLAGGAGAASENAPTFIVTLHSGEPREVAAEHARRYGADVEFVYEHALRGYAARVSEGQIGALARDGRVARVERDGPVQAVGTQNGATWGLDRIDQRQLPLSTTYDYSTTGAGVTAYIIDTGIRTTHDEFGTRASVGYDSFGGNGDDCNGHGTHVAGTVGGSTWGVAKGVTLVGVRVLDCNGSGTWSGVIAGLDWVTGVHVAGAPAVANMSLGGGASSSVDDAVQRAIDDGVSVAVAAGNGNRGGKEQDACGYSPARVPDAITIGATNKSDAKTSWSNYGDCVDWFAPGYQITSAWIDSDTDSHTISGTSMATPHVAGAAALYLETNTTASPLQVRNALYDATTKGIVTSSSTANNHLLYTGASSGDGGTEDPAPTASFTYSCSSRSCTFDGTGSSDDVVSYSWNFGDGSALESGATASHSYATDGTFTVTLVVTDDVNQTDDQQQQVTVSGTTSDGISLTASGYKVRGLQKADLSWSGATGTNVDVRRDGVSIATTGNDGVYTDNIDRNGNGTYRYQVCEADMSTCSNEVTVTFT